jgi:hypothetical protein
MRLALVFAAAVVAALALSACAVVPATGGAYVDEPVYAGAPCCYRVGYVVRPVVARPAIFRPAHEWHAAHAHRHGGYAR